MTPMVLATVGTTIVTILLVGVSVMLMGLVLLQKNRGSGLSGAFGGVGGHTAFGTKTGDFLTWITVAFTALFLGLSVIGVYVFVPEKMGATPTPQIAPEPGAADEAAQESVPASPAPATPAEGTAKPAQPVSPPPAAPAEPAPAQQPTTPPAGSGQ